MNKVARNQSANPYGNKLVALILAENTAIETESIVPGGSYIYRSLDNMEIKYIPLGVSPFIEGASFTANQTLTIKPDTDGEYKY